MVNEKLLDYVKLSLNKGVSKKKLMDLLLGKGWSASEINGAISLIEAIPEKLEIGSKPTESSSKLKFPGNSKIVDILIKIGVKDSDTARRIIEDIVKPEYLDSLIEQFEEKMKQKNKK